MLEIGMLGSMWRGLETGSSEHRASPRPYRPQRDRGELGILEWLPLCPP